MKFGIVVFPGSNCDRDCFYFLSDVLGGKGVYLWHEETLIPNLDLLVLPGGFSYGDYLRCGAIARFSPILREVVRFAKEGRPLIGICNGFQILTEARLLPGVLMRNRDLRFLCRDVHLKTKTHRTPFTVAIPSEKILRLPIAHMDGNYFDTEDALKRLEDQDQIVFQYCNAKGDLAVESNPNGAQRNIAGICNKQGNVLGLMPHPERAGESILGSEDGRWLFTSMLGVKTNP